MAAVGNLGNTDKGVYRSTDGGTNWTKITTGLPASFNGFIRFDNVPTIGNRDTIIASIGVSKTSTTELYRSTNFGSSWASLSTSGHTSYQYWCAHDVAIRPTHTDSIMMGGVPLYRYLISTSSRSSSISNVHSDIHDIEYDPSNSNKVYVTCDGGIYKSTNGGGTFSSINSGLAATQF